VEEVVRGWTAVPSLKRSLHPSNQILTWSQLRLTRYRMLALAERPE